MFILYVFICFSIKNTYIRKITMNIYILLSFISLIICSPPPIPEPPYEGIIVKNVPLVIKDNQEISSLKNLEEESTPSSKQIIEKYKVVRNYLENGFIEEVEIKVSTLNLEDLYFYPSFIYNHGLREGDLFVLESSTCQIFKITDDSPVAIECTLDQDSEDKIHKLTFNYKLYNDEYSIIKYKYRITQEKKDILYRQEAIRISKNEDNGDCEYKFIIPEEYISLGLKNNLLTKETENTYIYNAKCPNNEAKDDVIRFTPKISYWKAKVGLYFESSSPIDKNLTLTFPRFYKGGKLRNNIYKIITYENKLLEETDLIHDEIFLKAELPGKNNKEIGLNIYTTFSNKLDEEFNLYTESVFQLDTNVNELLSNKATELINGITSVSEKFYKIGSFVYNHITYDLSYLGRNLTALEIYQGKRGVCEHYTILYNAMLNAIGIKTVKIFGWSFDKDRTSADENTVGHAWTGALNSETGKIVELDATWNLFEGIPSGHILKGFNQEIISRSTGYDYYKTHNIQLVENLDSIDDPIVYRKRIEDEPTNSVLDITIDKGGNEDDNDEIKIEDGKINENGKDKDENNKNEKDDEKDKNKDEIKDEKDKNKHEIKDEKDKDKDNDGKNIKMKLVFISLLFLLL